MQANQVTTFSFSSLTFRELKEFAAKINDAFFPKDTENYTQRIKLSGKGRNQKAILADIEKFVNELDENTLRLLEENREIANHTSTIKMVSDFKLSKCLEYLENIHVIKTEEVKPKPEKTISKFRKYKPSSSHYISANSPNVVDQFSRIGFVDQNGYPYLGNEARVVLQALWDCDDREEIRPPKEVKQSGYHIQATVTISPVTKEVEVVRDGILTKQNRPIYISHRQFVYENGNKNCKVITQGFNGSKIRAVDTKEIIRGNEVFLDNILSVDWHVGKKIEVRKPQNIGTTQLRKQSVKTKISWGTGYVSAEYDGNIAYGNNILLPDNNGLDSSTRYRVVLETSGQINLYTVKTCELFITLGTFTSAYNTNTNKHDIEIRLYKSIYEERPYWVQPLDKGIQGILFSISNSKKDSLYESVTARNFAKIGEFFRDKQKGLSKKKQKKEKAKARKAIFGLYDKGYNLPIDVIRACDELRFHKGLEDKHRSYYNRLILGYYQSEIEGLSTEQLEQLRLYTSPKKKMYDFTGVKKSELIKIK